MYACDAANGKRLAQWSIRQGVAGSAPLLASLLNVEEPGRWVAFVARVEVRSGLEQRSFTGLMAGSPTPAAVSADGRFVLAFERPPGFGDKPSPLFVWDTAALPPEPRRQRRQPARVHAKEFTALTQVALSATARRLRWRTGTATSFCWRRPPASVCTRLGFRIGPGILA